MAATFISQGSPGDLIGELSRYRERICFNNKELQVPVGD